MSAGSSIPAFLTKLWRIVNDPNSDQLICWSEDGHNFVIQNEGEFWYTLLPMYYKHNNMASFIRQLNMYGFHKLSGDADTDKDEIKFFHPYFQRDQPQLLKHIKRKVSNSKVSTQTKDDNQVNNVHQITKVLSDVKQLRGKQESVDTQLAAMKQENAALWRELALLRQKHLKQQQIVNKLIHFLVQIVQPSRNNMNGLGVKRRMPLMINDSKFRKRKRNGNSDGPTIHELDPEMPGNINIDIDNRSPVASTIIDSPSSSSASVIENEDLLNIDNIDIEDDEQLQESTLPGEILLSAEEEDGSADTSLNNSNINDLFDSSALNTDNVIEPTENINFVDDVITDKDILNAAEGNYEIDMNDIKLEAAPSESTSQEVLNPNAMITSILGMPTENKPKEKNLTVATRNNNELKVNSADDLGNHVDSTQGELENIKATLFDGYSLDSNAILGTQFNNRFDAVPLQLFTSDIDLPLDLPSLTNIDNSDVKLKDNNDDLAVASDSDLTSYDTFLDFDNLFQDSPEILNDSNYNENIASTIDEINTPVVIKKEPPTYPVVKRSK